MKVHHVGLWVKDLARAGRFYQQVMGFEKQYGYHAPTDMVRQIFGRDTACDVAVYRREEVTLELFHPDQKMADSEAIPLIPAINHFALKVPDKRAFCREAQGKGAQVIEVTREAHCVYFIRDPEGILIEIKDK